MNFLHVLMPFNFVHVGLFGFLFVSLIIGHSYKTVLIKKGDRILDFRAWFSKGLLIGLLASLFGYAISTIWSLLFRSFVPSRVSFASDSINKINSINMMYNISNIIHLVILPVIYTIFFYLLLRFYFLKSEGYDLIKAKDLAGDITKRVFIILIGSQILIGILIAAFYIIFLQSMPSNG